MGLALGAFSTAWESPLLDDAPMPDVDPPQDRMTERAPRHPRHPAASLRRADGVPAPVRARRCSAARTTERWAAGSACVRSARSTPPAVALLADAWFPAPWPRLRALAPAPTIDLTVHFRAPLPIADGLLLGRFRSSLTRDGFFDEDGELWAPDGTLIAQSRQLGLLIGAEA